MARIPMVTRTITTTKAEVLCLDIMSAEPFNQTVTLPRTYKDEKTLMKKVAEIIDCENVKAVHVVAKEEVETLYGMTEQEFITLAKPLPPRGSNKNGEEDGEYYAEDDSEEEYTNEG